MEHERNSGDSPSWTEEKLTEPIDRKQFFRRAGIGLAASSAALAGGGALLGAGDGTALASNGDASINGVTINFLGLDGEDGKVEGAAFRKAHHITLKSTYISSGDELFAKLKVGQIYDLLSIPNPNVTVLSSAGLIRPLDTSRIPNLKQMFPVLLHGKFDNQNGHLYSVPLIWGDGPYVYDTRKLKLSDIPKSILSMGDPKWSHKLVTLDDPYSVIGPTAAALGYSSTYLTKTQLAHTVDSARKIMKNLVAIATSYGDETDYLVRGEAELGISGWEAQLNMAAAKGVKLGYGFFATGNSMWCDSLGIPTDAKQVDAAYAYINYMIGARIDAKVATNQLSGTVNRYAYGHIPPKVAHLYDYSAVKDFNSPRKVTNWLPPENPPSGIESLKDWQAAWQSLKA